MTESYKFKSKIATAVGAVATVISIVGQDYLISLFPSFGQYVPIVVAIATWYLSQSTENRRVEVAEQLIRENYIGADGADNSPNLNEDYTFGDEEDES